MSNTKYNDPFNFGNSKRRSSNASNAIFDIAELVVVGAVGISLINALK